jgi:hypothetical protein
MANEQRLPQYIQIGVQYPIVVRDFRQGRYIPYSVSTYLAPSNSVSFCRNVNFDTIIGSAVVRKGTTLVGATVASGKTPLGLTEYVNTFNNVNLNYLIAVFPGASTATASYWNGTSWQATNQTGLSNTYKDRFAVLGGSLFMCNSTNGMLAAPDGITFATLNCITTVKPSLVYRYQSTLLCAGDPTYPSRVWFSSVISPVSSPFITWNNDPSTGDWIDVNPDDGGWMTGFAESSTFLILFKSNAMYRINAVASSAQPQLIYNVGAVCQEGITACQGVAYFFSGSGIYSTDGSFPVQQGRGMIQDIVDNIPQANWTSVAAGHDEFNVYFSVGTVTVGASTDNPVTYTNCVLKYSTRDQTWSVHTYANLFNFFSQFTDSNGRLTRGATTAGDVQTLNLGTTDNGNPINYEMTTQDIDFANRAHDKSISDQLIVFAQNGQDSTMDCFCDGEKKDIPITLTERVNYGKNINLEGHFFNFHWFGETSGTSPVFEGFTIEAVQDNGLTP